MRGWVKKKNSLSDDYPLADFTEDNAKAQTAPNATTPSQAKQPSQEKEPTVAVPHNPTPAVATKVEQGQVNQGGDSGSVAQTITTDAAPNAPRRPRQYSTTLSALLANEQPAEEITEGDKAAQPSKEDPAAERKLNECRTIIFDDIRTLRPRFVAAFDNMRFEGSTIFLKAPSQALYEEIMRSKTEILMRIAEIAHINGTLYFEITVDETIKASRPIKLEDRVKFLSDKNPAIGELRKALDLEVE